MPFKINEFLIRMNFFVIKIQAAIHASLKPKLGYPNFYFIWHNIEPENNCYGAFAEFWGALLKQIQTLHFHVKYNFMKMAMNSKFLKFLKIL